MAISALELDLPQATSVTISDDSLVVDLIDGRSLAVPLTWFPRLMNASEQERQNWRLIGRGDGIHWPDLDEDISVSALLAGQPSNESARSLKKWLAARK